jgi:hypothetical protein
VTYPTANLDKIQSRLLQLSTDLARAIGSKFSRMGEMLVPLSMALITNYDDDYLGIRQSDNPEEKQTP